MSKKKKEKSEVEDDFRLYRRIKCPKCGAKGWQALKKEIVKGELRIVSCDLCPSFWDHH